MLTTADLHRLAATLTGRYVQQHMPPAAQALRLTGDALTVAGARRQRAALIAAGLALVAAGWCHGLLPTRTAGPSRTDAGP